MDSVLQEGEISTVSYSANRELTFGEKLVGLTFNPSGDANVNKAKRLCADLADLLFNNYASGSEKTLTQEILFKQSVGEILNAQMNVVKVLTFKY